MNNFWKALLKGTHVYLGFALYLWATKSTFGMKKDNRIKPRFKWNKILFDNTINFIFNCQRLVTCANTMNSITFVFNFYLVKVIKNAISFTQMDTLWSWLHKLLCFIENNKGMKEGQFHFIYLRFLAKTGD